MSQRTALAVLAAIAATLAAAPAAVAAPSVDLRGVWSVVSTVEKSSNSFTSTLEIASLDCDTGSYFGSGSGGAYTWPELGKLDGTNLKGTSGPYDQLPAYTASWSVSFASADAASGTFTDTSKQAGTTTWTRKSGPPAEGRCPGITYPDPTPTPTIVPHATPTPTPAATPNPTPTPVMATPAPTAAPAKPLRPLAARPDFSMDAAYTLTFDVPIEVAGTRVDVCATAKSTGTVKAPKGSLGGSGAAAASYARLLSNGSDEQILAGLPTLDKLVTKLVGEATTKSGKQGAAAKSIANVLKTKHDTCKNSVGNIRALGARDNGKGKGKTKPKTGPRDAATGLPSGRRMRVLGNTGTTSAPAGLLPVTLKLKGSTVRAITTAKKPLTIYVYVLQTVPSSVVKGGIPRIAAFPVKISRDGMLTG